ncbi:hypothetical protein FH968_22380 [Buttiauxella sp. B2]|nr:hypothetical protein FH968_22380 [Buttiauxella sp. B2]
MKQPDNLSKLSHLSGVPESNVPVLMKGNTYLTASKQSEQLNGPVNKVIVVPKSGGQSPEVEADYSQLVTVCFVRTLT